MFIKTDQDFSDVMINSCLEPYFYEVLERTVDVKSLSEDMQLRRKKLVEEAQRNFIAEFMQKIEMLEPLGSSTS